MLKRWNGCVENAGQEAKASTTHQHIHQAVPVSWFPASRLHLGPTYLVYWFFSFETMHPLLWRLVVWKPVAKSFAERWQLLYLLTLLDFMAIIVLKSSVKSDSLAEYCWRLRCLKFCLQSAVNSNIAKGTMDPRGKYFKKITFLKPCHMLVKIQVQNLNQTSASKSQLNFNVNILTKPQPRYLEQYSASKSLPICWKHVPHHQNQQK